MFKKVWKGLKRFKKVWKGFQKIKEEMFEEKNVWQKNPLQSNLSEWNSILKIVSTFKNVQQEELFSTTFKIL